MPNDQTAQADTAQTPPEKITYTPTVWKDGEDGGTPINAANMNNIEEAIVALVERTTMKIVSSMIEDGAITKDKLEKSLGDSLSLVSVYGQAERAIFYITSDGKAGVEVYDKSGGRHYIVGNS